MHCIKLCQLEKNMQQNSSEFGPSVSKQTVLNKDTSESYRSTVLMATGVTVPMNEIVGIFGCSHYTSVQ